MEEAQKDDDAQEENQVKGDEKSDQEEVKVASAEDKVQKSDGQAIEKEAFLDDTFGQNETVMMRASADVGESISKEEEGSKDVRVASAALDDDEKTAKTIQK